MIERLVACKQWPPKQHARLTSLLRPPLPEDVVLSLIMVLPDISPFVLGIRSSLAAADTHQQAMHAAPPSPVPTTLTRLPSDHWPAVPDFPALQVGGRLASFS